MRAVELRCRRDTVAALHALDPFADGAPDAPAVWLCEPADAAVVVGSRQGTDLVDGVACSRAGLSVVRRRSGGGSVLLRPHAVVWIDVVVPHGVLPDDVRASMVAVGELWRDAIVASGVLDADRLELHRGGMVATPWSDLVCFAGLGPGEVSDHGAGAPGKLVGLSQRRGRHGLRIQGLLYTEAVSWELPGLFAGPVPAEPLPDTATAPGVDGEQVAALIADSLADA